MMHRFALLHYHAQILLLNIPERFLEYWNAAAFLMEPFAEL